MFACIIKAFVTSEKAFVPMPKVFVCSTINMFGFYLEGGLKTPEKEQKPKNYSKASLQLRMTLKKGQKQGRNERTQEDYLTSAQLHSRCRVIFWVLSSLPSFCPTLLEMKFYKNFSPNIKVNCLVPLAVSYI